MKKKYLDLTGLTDFLNNLYNTFSKKNHIHNVATSSNNGFMSADEHTKLENIEEAATNNTISIVRWS